MLSGYRQRLAITKARAARPQKAAPATPDALREMLATLDRETLLGKRDAALLLLLGYACAARVSELTALDLDDVVETEDGLLVTVYRRKLKRHDEVAVPYGSNPATCPVRATAHCLPPSPPKGAPTDRCSSALKPHRSRTARNAPDRRRTLSRGAAARGHAHWRRPPRRDARRLRLDSRPPRRVRGRAPCPPPQLTRSAPQPPRRQASPPPGTLASFGARLR
ncbi:hypothetical protein AB0L17_35545 [Streptomyces cellulosae]